MPYVRRYRRKASSSRRRAGAGAGRVSKSVKRYVKRATLRQAETKYLCTPQAATSISDTTMTLISPNTMRVPQGDGAASRDGDEIRGLYSLMRFTVAAGDSTNLVRIMVLNSVSTALWTSDLPTSVGGCVTPELRDKATVLRDFIVKVNTTTLGNTVKTVRLNWKGAKISYDGSATADPIKGIYVYAISDSAAVTHPSVSTDCQFAYKDM